MRRDKAKNIINIEMARVKPFVWHINVPVTSLPNPNSETFMACCFNAGDMQGVNIVLYENPLIAQSDLFHEDAFALRIRAGLIEEILHTLQIQEVATDFSRLTDEAKEGLTALKYYRLRQKEMLEELSCSVSGREMLVAAGTLYYEDSSINDIESLKKVEMRDSKVPGYVTVEAARQINQLRLYGKISEQARSVGWDPQHFFNTDPVQKVEELTQTLKDSYQAALADCPKFKSFIEQTETRLHKIPVNLRMEDNNMFWQTGNQEPILEEVGYPVDESAVLL